MGLIRQYLKQKVARSFGGKKIDMDVIKKELKDEITHILYDQTRRTPIVIPVINEIGGGGQRPDGNRQQHNGEGQQQQQSQPQQQRDNRPQQQQRPMPRKFPPRQLPDSEATVPRPPTRPNAY